MNIVLQTLKVSTLLFLVTCAVSSQTTNSLTQEKRSEESFRVLNDAGINFENMITKVTRLILKEYNGQAQVECAAFLRDLSAMRDSLRNDHGLAGEDIRFVDGRLESLQKKGERLLENLPFGLKVNY